VKRCFININASLHETRKIAKHFTKQGHFLTFPRQKNPQTKGFLGDLNMSVNQNVTGSSPVAGAISSF
jgi:hypothetical protein